LLSGKLAWTVKPLDTLTGGDKQSLTVTGLDRLTINNAFEFTQYLEIFGETVMPSWACIFKNRTDD